MTIDLSALHIGGVVLDIEGTTTPIAFVYETLFPYARAHVAHYLEQEGDSSTCRAAAALLREDHARDLERGESPPPLAASASGSAGAPQDLGRASLVTYVYWLMDRDTKSPGLKMLQGLVWEKGYRAGELNGAVYPDVFPALERWQALGRRVFIYSSGSVLAQQLLFGSTNTGDLTRFLSGYFDTTVGSKTSPESYRIITGRIDVPASRTLFVSDVEAELEAAREAGFQTTLCVRRPDSRRSALAESRHTIIETFDELVG